MLDVTGFGANPAAGNDDYPAVAAANSYQAHIGDFVKLRDGSQHQIGMGDAITGLYFPAGEYAFTESNPSSGDLQLNPNYTYEGAAGKDPNTANDAIIIAPSVANGGTADSTFCFREDPSNVVITNLQFSGPAIDGRGGSSRSNVTIEDCSFTGAFTSDDTVHDHDRYSRNAIAYTTALISSGITDNDFHDMPGLDAAVFVNTMMGNVSISNNRFWDLSQGIHTTDSSDSHDLTIDSNVGQRLGIKLIECNGAGASNLYVTNNRASDFTNFQDPTFGISVSIHRDNPGGTHITGNQVSDIPNIDNPPVRDPGVRIGIEVAGGDGTDAEHNTVYGMIDDVVLNNTVHSTVSNNTLIDWTSTAAHNQGVAVVNGTTGETISNNDNSADLRPNTAVTVAFDRIVTGTSDDDVIHIDSSGAITVNGSSAGSIPSDGPLVGRAIIYGLGGDDTITACPALAAHVVLQGGFGAGTPTARSGAFAGYDTMSAGAGAESIFGDNGHDSITLDMSRADLFPDATIFADGGTGAISGGVGDHTLTILGSTGDDALDDTVPLDPSTFEVTQINGSATNDIINFSGGINAAGFSGAGGNDAITISRSFEKPMTLDAATNNTIVLPAGTTLPSLNITGSGTVKDAAQNTPNSSAGVMVVNSLSVGSSSHFDLTNNSMIIDYSGSVGTLVNDTRLNLLHGRLITTASIPADTALGYGDNAVLGKTTFAGQNVDSTSVLIKFTYQGDADLDGDADGVDIGTWATNFTGELGGTGTKVWTEGDWDYDGDVDGVDAGLWAQAFTGEGGGAGLRPSGGEGGGGDAGDDLATGREAIGPTNVNGPVDPDAIAILKDIANSSVPELYDVAWLWA
jgi:hypothetical protein